MACLTSFESYDTLEPIYAELPGWKQSTYGVRSLEELPVNARNYIKFIEDKIEAPVDSRACGIPGRRGAMRISTGRSRNGVAPFSKPRSNWSTVRRTG